MILHGATFRVQVSPNSDDILPLFLAFIRPNGSVYVASTAKCKPVGDEMLTGELGGARY
jgi:hypothetical protein